MSLLEQTEISYKKRSLSRICLLISFGLLSLRNLSGQDGMSSVTGSLLDASGNPIGGAKVTLFVEGTKQPPEPRRFAPLSGRTVTSDMQGRFEFFNLPTGRYVLGADKPGFLRSAFGAENASLDGVVLPLSGSNAINDLKFVLTRGGTISGRVLGPDAEPFEEVEVVLIGTRLTSTGPEPVRLPIRGALNSPTSGFKIVGIPPGDYYLRAEALIYRSTGPPQGVPTYYPSAVDLRGAKLLHLDGESNLTNIEIKIVTVPFHGLKGRVTGDVLPKVLFLQSRDGVQGANVSVNADGSFQFPPLPRGQYVIHSGAADDPPYPASNVFRDPAGSQIYLRVDVAEDDLILDVKSPKLFGITGRVEFEGWPTNQPIPDVASLHLIDVDSGRQSRGADILENGQFAFERLWPARYAVTAEQLPEGWYISRVQVGDRSYSPSNIDLSGAAAEAAFVVVERALGEISGIILGDDNRAAPGAAVMLVPRPHIAHESSRYRSVRTDLNGAFVIRNVPRGSYTVSAWDALPLGGEVVDELPRANAGNSVSVEIGDSSKIAIQLYRGSFKN